MKKEKTDKPIEYYRSMSVEELFADALVHDFKNDENWDSISELCIRGTEEIFEKAKKAL